MLMLNIASTIHAEIICLTLFIYSSLQILLFHSSVIFQTSHEAFAESAPGAARDFCIVGGVMFEKEERCRFACRGELFRPSRLETSKSQTTRGVEQCPASKEAERRSPGVIRHHLRKVAAYFSSSSVNKVSAFPMKPVYVQRSCTLHGFPYHANSSNRTRNSPFHNNRENILPPTRGLLANSVHAEAVGRLFRLRAMLAGHHIQGV
jgi:hypothetical protein